MTDRNASIVDKNIQTPPSPIDTLKAGFDRDLVGDVENIRFNFCTGGTKGGFRLFNGFLIAIKQCDGSTSFDKGCCCRSADPVAPPVMTATSPSRRKRSSIYSAKIGSTTQVRDMRSSRGME
jgi:hypothetical protein